MMKAKQTGFTLIELVVVIVILGILAAMALPRFAALQVQARVAKLNAALGAVKGGAALTHASCLATTGCAMAAYTLTMEGVGVTLIAQYPTADAAGIISAAGLTISAAEGYQTSGGGAAEGDVLTVQVLGNAPATCFFTYTAATSAAGVITSPPLYSAVTTTGC